MKQVGSGVMKGGAPRKAGPATMPGAKTTPATVPGAKDNAGSQQVYQVVRHQKNGPSWTGTNGPATGACSTDGD